MPEELTKTQNRTSLIDFKNYPVSLVLASLLKDKTTGENIIFATPSYVLNGTPIKETEQITITKIRQGLFNVIKPRVTKSYETQAERTRKKAEVFTPSWVCNKMNNHCDAEWFGRENVFNTEKEKTWIPTTEHIQFENPNDWKKYVDSKRLEITCGEAPYIVSRYDTTTGGLIPINHRIGILDRKLRIVSENTKNEDEWLKWVYRAFQSVYGYEFQGDNLLIARINLLNTFDDYVQEHLNRTSTEKELKKIANIIVWNIWQMDGITGTIPFRKPQKEEEQLSLFDFELGINDDEPEAEICKIYDWTSKKTLTYTSIKGNRK